ncbi:MarR family transcriptional regulator [soil metagenome]
MGKVVTFATVVYATNIMNEHDSYILNDSIGYLTGRVKREMTRLLTRSLQEAGGEITAEQFRLVMMLWKKEVLNQQCVADEYGKDKASVARMLQTMESHGWITRKADVGDKRNNLIYITDAGQKIGEKYYPALKELLRNADAAVTEDEMITCKETLRKIIHHLCEVGEGGCKADK